MKKHGRRLERRFWGVTQRPAAMHAVVVLVHQGRHADRSTLEKRKNGKVERGSRGRERWLTRLRGDRAGS